MDFDPNSVFSRVNPKTQKNFRNGYCFKKFLLILWLVYHVFCFPFVAAFIFITSPSSRCQYPALHPGRYASILLITSYATPRGFIFFLTYTSTLFQSPTCRHRVTGQMLEVNLEIQIGINFHRPGKDHPMHCKLAITTRHSILK